MQLAGPRNQSPLRPMATLATNGEMSLRRPVLESIALKAVVLKSRAAARPEAFERYRSSVILRAYSSV